MANSMTGPGALPADGPAHMLRTSKGKQVNSPASHTLCLACDQQLAEWSTIEQSKNLNSCHS